VRADGEVGVVRPAVGDGFEDGQVLGQRDLGAAGAQRELELVPDQLGVQPVEQPDRDVLPGDHPDPAVQLPVELGVPERVAFGHRALEILPEIAQLGHILVADAQRCPDRAERLQGHPALGDRHRLLGGDDTDPGTAVGYALDEPIRREVKQRRAQGLPGHPERASEVLLDQPPPGGEFAAEDCLPDRGEGAGAGGLPDLRPARRSCWHVPNATYVPADCQQSTMARLLTIRGKSDASAAAPMRP
jgi:hypothetical protein